MNGIEKVMYDQAMDHQGKINSVLQLLHMFLSLYMQKLFLFFYSLTINENLMVHVSLSLKGISFYTLCKVQITFNDQEQNFFAQNICVNARYGISIHVSKPELLRTTCEGMWELCVLKDHSETSLTTSSRGQVVKALNSLFRGPGFDSWVALFFLLT